MRPFILGAAVASLGFAFAAPAVADTVVADDQIVQGSQCVGPDCVNNESFGFDTLRLKGPTLRFGFTDTSAAPGFPTNDWELTVNDADGAGSQGFFGFTDVTGGTTPFRVLAATPTDALRVESDGRVTLSSGPVAQRVETTNTENSTAADPNALISALSSLPISTYEYTADPANTRHIGPLASDFQTAFGLGSSTDVAPADLSGVALAVGKELSKRVTDLTGPQGPQGAQGDSGPKGDTGPAGADAPSGTAFSDALAKLSKLEKRTAYLEKHNTSMKSKLARLAAKIQALRKKRSGR